MRASRGLDADDPWEFARLSGNRVDNPLVDGRGDRQKGAQRRNDNLE